MNEPIHVAITRRIKPGCEAEFQTALQEFFRTSFAHTGVHGASMLVPPPGSPSPEFGILRTFANAQQRDDFYASLMFKAWEERIKPLTEGTPEYRELTGLEAWFRNPHNPPPRWKMAIATYAGVLPVVMGLSLTIGPTVRPLNFVLNNAIFNACVVALLTWLVMPLITRALRGWLQPKPNIKHEYNR
ncbi:MAG TPA: antibiotic biosynthesis monooxygenase [Verrucomicrobiae bacterium]|nr:antibiotic biosynthesis monooxygenase [Verrucomicrobiae bacterium]